MEHKRVDSCWFYGASAAPRDYSGDVGLLRAGAVRLRDEEVVVRVDGGATFYVMPVDIFWAVAHAGAANLSAIAVESGVSVLLLQTAVHRNVAMLPGNGEWEALTLGNLTGGGAYLFCADACPALAELAGRKLADVVLAVRTGEYYPLLELKGWRERD